MQRLSNVNVCSTDYNTQHWLDFAKITFGGNFSDKDVNEAKSFLKVFALFLSFIPYWVCNSQAYSTFIYQGFHLNQSVGNVTVPVSWLALFNIIAMLIFVKISEKIIAPCLRRNGRTFSTTWRISFGMICTCISMALAGSVQLYAHQALADDVGCFQAVGKTNMTCVSRLHIMWTVPQYAFLGISEVLVSLTGLGLAYKLCPGVFKKLTISANYLMVAIGNIISLIIVSFGWFPARQFFENYEMVIYFFSLSAFSLFGLIVFLWVVPNYGNNSESTVINNAQRTNPMNQRETVGTIS